MARPYPLDLRERVVASVAGGRSCRAVAALFDVSVASVVKWSQRDRATGSAAAKPMGGNRPLALAGERDWLLVRLTQKPEPTLHALLAELRQRGVIVACDTLWRFLRREGISFKRRRVRRRAGSACCRAMAAPVDAVSKAHQSCPSGVHRRDPGTRAHGLPFISGPGAEKPADGATAIRPSNGFLTMEDFWRGDVVLGHRCWADQAAWLCPKCL